MNLQKFIFETDDLLSLEKMLQVVVPLVLKSTDKNKNYWLNMQTHLFDYSWDTGSYDNPKDGPFVLEDRGQTLILNHSATYGGASILSPIMSFDNSKGKAKDLAAAEACKMHEAQNPRIPTRMLICALGDNYEKNATHTCGFDTYSEMIAAALKRASNTNKDKFYKLCGDGFGEFDCGDGDIDIGYRLHYAPPGRIFLSMVYFYYGK